MWRRDWLLSRDRCALLSTFDELVPPRGVAPSARFNLFSKGAHFFVGGATSRAFTVAGHVAGNLFKTPDLALT